MEMPGLFNETIQQVSRALDLRSMRHNVIVSNLANADTPGYKAFDLIVEEEMQRQNRNESGLNVETSRPGHLAGRASSAAEVHLTETELPFSISRGDGNTVDFEREMGNLTDNNMRYNVLAQSLARKFRGLKDVIKEG